MRTVLAILAWLVIRLLSLTWRVRLVGPDPDLVKPPRVFCFWHGEQAGLFGHPRHHPLVVLASLSRDGDLQAKILRRFGFTVVRGSSSRGGAQGLKALVRELETGKDALFAVDGPRGPNRRVKPGAILASKTTGAPLIPIRIGASRAWVFLKAWDRYTLPKPFATVEINRGAPILPDGGDLTLLSQNLAHALKTTGS